MVSRHTCTRVETKCKMPSIQGNNIHYITKFGREELEIKYNDLLMLSSELKKADDII